MTTHTLTIYGNRTLLNGETFLAVGLRCSNALVREAATRELIVNLETFRSFGVNTISVFFMGSRFGDCQGYNRDGTLSAPHALRMGRIIEAADALGMVVIVGCLYWGASRAKWAHWTQAEANTAVAETVRWLAQHDYRNVIIDVDNEGMALRQAGFDNRELVLAGKAVDPGCIIATNFKGDPPPEADLGIHFANPVPDKPYIESEGSPAGTPGGYWGPYSKEEGLYGYIRVGEYTAAMKASQIATTAEYLDRGWGYVLASTWLQAAPPQGPNHRPGGYGGPTDPGVRWWLEWLKRDA